MTLICLNPKEYYCLIWHNGRRTTARYWIGRWSWWRLMRLLDAPTWQLVARTEDEYFLQGDR